MFSATTKFQKRLWTGALALALMFSLPLRSSAQADSGRIVGAVTDTTGAAIPGASIILVNPSNGLKLTGKSNGQGELNVPAIPPGTYDVTISAAGFQSGKQRITLDVTQNLTLDFKLRAGESTTIDVDSAATLVNTTDATLGEVIEGKQITELPLNGRNALNLALLTPGVTQGRYGEASQDTANRYGTSGSGAISVNGTRVQANNFILDGVDNNDGLQNNIVFFPAVEATQQFKVVTSVAPAQYGRAGGALIIASLRSGTNQIHGTAYEYYRSGHFGANPNYLFAIVGNKFAPAPINRRAQFGGSAGMPLIKDKLFIFGDYAGLRENKPLNATQITVPTALMRQGNFSELLNTQLTGGKTLATTPKCNPAVKVVNAIYDPLTCTQVSYNGQLNVINPARLNTAAVNYLNAFPLPTFTNVIQNNYTTNQSVINKYNTFDVRLDWHPTSKDILFARFSYDNSTNTQTSALGTALPAGSGSGSSYTHARGYVLGSTHTFSPHIVNEARLAYNRDNFGYQPPNYGQYLSAGFGIVNANRDLSTTGGALIGGSSTQLSYTGDFGLFAVPENTEELTDTVALSFGRHNVQAGGTALLRQVAFFRPLNGKGTFNIAGNGVDFTGYEVAELLIGGVDSYSIGSQNGFFRQNSQEDAVFVQDDWRVTPRLTINAGMRWDYLQWPYEQHDKEASFTTAGTILLANKNGVSRSIINQDYLNFAPRIGFAYSLTQNGKSALHGGYGIFYFPDYGGISNQPGQQPPYGGSVNYSAGNGYCITFTGQTPTLNTPYTCPGYTSTAAVQTPLPAPGFPNFDPNHPSTGLGGVAFDQNNKHSRLQQYNLQLQQQFGARDVFSVTYAGTYGDRLSSYYNYNAYLFGSLSLPFPTLGGISLNRYDGVSNYNGLQLHVDHRMQNLLVTGSYTWSKTLDDSPGAFQSSTVTSYANPRIDYGPSQQDVRHNFSSSAIYNLPFGKGQRFLTSSGRLMDLLVGGFQLNLVTFLRTGGPSDTNVGNYNPGNRLDLIGTLKYPKQVQGFWFDPTAFSNAIPTAVSTDGKKNTVFTRVGTAGRNVIYGPSTRVVNFSVQKNLHLQERTTLELHGDAFNVFNTPQFTNPGVNYSNPGRFGYISGLKQDSARQIQIAARLVF